jgi:hypothetical protein
MAMIEWFKALIYNWFIGPSKYRRAYESWSWEIKSLQLQYSYARQDIREGEMRAAVGLDAVLLEDDREQLADIKAQIRETVQPIRSSYVYRRPEV